VCAGLGQRLGDSGAEAARTARHERSLAGQVNCCHVVPPVVHVPVSVMAITTLRVFWTLVKISRRICPDAYYVRVTKALESNRERVSRRQVDKFSQRRDELAEAALTTLAELGYARTSLREIAQNTDFSHGVLHYYFSDKVDLITHCVKHYKAICVQRYDEVLRDAETADGLAEGFALALAGTARDDASLHRLWYDMRSQSMFEPAFRADVIEIDDSLQHMIWRVVSRYGELAGRPLIVEPTTAYAIFDGLFQQALLRHIAGSPDVLSHLITRARALLPSLLKA
jgi:AcrR family transcriptional regulator